MYLYFTGTGIIFQVNFSTGRLISYLSHKYKHKLTSDIFSMTSNFYYTVSHFTFFGN